MPGNKKDIVVLLALGGIGAGAYLLLPTPVAPLVVGAACIGIGCYLTARVVEHTTRLRMHQHAEQARLRAARQVAHDLRSPLTALNLVVDELDPLPLDQQVLLRTAVRRIGEIADDLAGRRAADPMREAHVSTVSLRHALDKSLKDHHAADPRHPRLQPCFGSETRALFVRTDDSRLQQLLRTLFDIATAACPGAPVDVALRSTDNEAVVVLLLPHGAIATGSIERAQAIAEALRGRIELHQQTYRSSSELTLTLARCPAPPWFVPAITLRPSHRLVVLDDDLSMHALWRQRFANLGPAGTALRVVYCATPAALREAVQGGSGQPSQYLLDYELLGHDCSGLDLAEELGIAQSSIIITSWAHDPALQGRCTRLNTSLLPKAMAATIALHVTEPVAADAVLLDDDSLVHATWAQAARRGQKALKSYRRADDLYADLPLFDKATPLYVDYNLGDDQDGGAVTYNLSTRGYTNLHLVTGEHPENLKPMPWLVDILGKTPPEHW